VTEQISLKAAIVNMPPQLREQLDGLSKMALIRRCAALRPGQVVDLVAASKYTLRAIARRWLELNAEIKTHEKILGELSKQSGFSSARPATG
jgi:transposase